MSFSFSGMEAAVGVGPSSPEAECFFVNECLNSDVQEENKKQSCRYNRP